MPSGRLRRPKHNCEQSSNVPSRLACRAATILRFPQCKACNTLVRSSLLEYARIALASKPSNPPTHPLPITGQSHSECPGNNDVRRP
eukprot:147162-Amphidinium_carterae.1